MNDSHQQPTVESVTVREVFARTGKSRGFEYTAHLSNGETEIVRKLATRRYARAFQYSVWIANKSGLAGHFSFGKAPAAYYGDKLVGSWAIQDEEA